MLARTALLYFGVVVLLPFSHKWVQAEETRGQAIAKALLEAYAGQPTAEQPPKASPGAVDSSRNQALELAQSILNNLPSAASSTGLATAASNNRPAAALDELKKLQDVLDTVRQREPARKIPITPAATPIINTQELVQLFSNPLPERDLSTQLKEATKSHPDNSVVWFLRAYQEQQLGHQRASKAALERALSTTPEGLIPDTIRAQLEEGIPAPK